MSIIGVLIAAHPVSLPPLIKSTPMKLKSDISFSGENFVTCATKQANLLPNKAPNILSQVSRSSQRN
jgi:hypothetical protein